jgi:hypothetical protein
VSLEGPAFRCAAVGLLAGMWAAYGVALLCLQRISERLERRCALLVVAGLAVAAHVLLVLLPPVLSTDLYQYGLFGRMVTRYHLNPYLTAPNAISGDPLWPYAGWRHLSSRYAPLFVWISAALTAIGGGGPIGEALVFKSAAAGSNLIACWAVRRLAIAAGSEDGLWETGLFALNPLILAESAGSGHPDSMMIALAFLGLLLGLRGRPVAGFAVLLLSAMIKYVTGVAAVLLAVQAIFAERGAAQRALMSARLAGVAVVLLAILYGPFWAGLHTFSAVANLATHGSSYQYSQTPGGIERPVALAIFLGLFVAAAVMAARLPRVRLVELSAALITFAMVFVMVWKVPWYFVAGLALSLAAPPTATNRLLRLVTLFLGILAMLAYGALWPTGRP